MYVYMCISTETVIICYAISCFGAINYNGRIHTLMTIYISENDQHGISLHLL